MAQKIQEQIKKVVREYSWERRLIFYFLGCIALGGAGMSLFVGTLDMQYELLRMQGRNPYGWLFGELLLIIGGAIGCFVVAKLSFVLWSLRVWREIFPGCPRRVKWLFWLVFLPVAGLYIMVLMTVAAAWKKGGVSMRLIAGLIALTAAVLASGVCGGGYVMNLFSILLLLMSLSVYQIAPFSPGRGGRVIYAVLLLIGVAGAVYSGWFTHRLQSRMTRVEDGLREKGSAITREEAAALYFDGYAPSQSYAELCEKLDRRYGKTGQRNYAHSPQLARFERSRTGGSYVHYTEEDYTKLAASIDKNSRFFDEIDRCFATSTVHKRPLDTTSFKNIEAVIYDWILHNQLAHIYQSRIAMALKNRDRDATVRLYDLMRNCSFTAQGGITFTNMLGGLSSVMLRMEILQNILSSGILEQADLEQLYDSLLADEMLARRSFARAMAGECAIYMTAFDILLQGKFVRRDLPYARWMAITAKGLTSSPLTATPAYWLFMNDRLFMGRTLLMAQRSFGDGGTDYSRARRRVEMLSPGFYSRKPFTFFSWILSPQIQPAFKRFNIELTQLRMARIAVAVELYRRAHGGELPEDMGQLGIELPPDPFTGRSFGYRYGRVNMPGRGNHGSYVDYGYRIYGVGQNMRPNGERLNRGRLMDEVFTVRMPELQNIRQ